MAHRTPPADATRPRHHRRRPAAAAGVGVGVAGVGVVLAVVVAVLLVVRPWERTPTAPPGPEVLAANAVVHRNVDGDTIEVRLDGSAPVTVRLLGIDAPESVKPLTPVQCFGREASARTRELLPPATRVHLVTDVEERDQYGRLLAYVYRSSDGLFVNLALVRDGYASILSYRPNTAHAPELAAAAVEARAAGRGLWGACPAAEGRRVA